MRLRWLAELLLGAKLAIAGGRDGWVRTGLTTIGVGLGVALLLAAASLPTVLTARDARADEPSFSSPRCSSCWFLTPSRSRHSLPRRRNLPHQRRKSRTPASLATAGTSTTTTKRRSRRSPRTCGPRRKTSA